MPGFNQNGLGGGQRGGQRMGGRRGTMCRRTEGRLFPSEKNGSGRGEPLRRGQFAGQGPEGSPSQPETMQNDLESLRAQYQAAQDMLKELEKKIQDLESGK